MSKELHIQTNMKKKGKKVFCYNVDDNAQTHM